MIRQAAIALLLIVPARMSGINAILFAAHTRKGDWELDTIIGTNHQQAIVTITERVLRA